MEKKNQCIHCSVESCRHLKEEQGICSLESIQVAPTPMAYSGDPADESMCKSYETKEKEETAAQRALPAAP